MNSRSNKGGDGGMGYRAEPGAPFRDYTTDELWVAELLERVAKLEIQVAELTNHKEDK